MGIFANVVGLVAQGNAHGTQKTGESALLPFGAVNQRCSGAGKAQLKSLCVIPLERNKNMVSRGFIFHKLNEKLPPIQDYQTGAIWGIGGAG